MSVDDNKRIVTQFWSAISSDQLEHAMALLADDATWWVFGSLPLSGTYSKTEFKGLLAKLLAVFPRGVIVIVNVKGLTAEGNRVAVEAESYGVDEADKIYNNFYHFLFEFRDHQIIAVREYMDTLHVNATFFA